MTDSLRSSICRLIEVLDPMRRAYGQRRMGAESASAGAAGDEVDPGKVLRCLASVGEAADVCRFRMNRPAEAPVIVGLFGGTGTGKSTLLNALAGKEVCHTSPIRPNTAGPILYLHRASCGVVTQAGNWLGLPVVPAEETGPPPYRGRSGALLLVPHTDERLRSVALLDCPDIDSFDDANRAAAGRILPYLDAVFLIAIYEKITQREYAETLERVNRLAIFKRLIVNKVDPAEERAIGTEAGAYVADRGWSDAPVLIARMAIDRLATGDMAGVESSRHAGSHTSESRLQAAPTARSETAPASESRLQAAPTARSETAPASESRLQAAPTSRSETAPTSESRLQAAPTGRMPTDRLTHDVTIVALRDMLVNSARGPRKVEADPVRLPKSIRQGLLESARSFLEAATREREHADRVIAELRELLPEPQYDLGRFTTELGRQARKQSWLYHFSLRQVWDHVDYVQSQVRASLAGRRMAGAKPEAGESQRKPATDRAAEYLAGQVRGDLDALHLALEDRAMADPLSKQILYRDGHADLRLDPQRLQGILQDAVEDIRKLMESAQSPEGKGASRVLRTAARRLGLPIQHLTKLVPYLVIADLVLVGGAVTLIQGTGLAILYELGNLGLTVLTDEVRRETKRIAQRFHAQYRQCLSDQIQLFIDGINGGLASRDQLKDLEEAIESVARRVRESDEERLTT